MDSFKVSLIALCCSLTIISNANAATIDELWDQTAQIPKLKQFHVLNVLQNHQESLPAKAQLFKLKNQATAGRYEYRLRNAFIDNEGVTHARYDEYYKNIRVLWADTIVHRKKSQSINGTMVTAIESDITNITPKLSAQQAIAIAKQNDANNNVRLMQNELVIYAYSKDAKARLAYQISYYAADRERHLANPYYVIDANTGEVLQHFDNLKRALAQVGTGPGGNTNPALSNGSYNYGVGAAPLAPYLLIQTDTPVAGTCTWSNPGIAVVSRGGATNDPSIFPVVTTDEANYPVYTVTPCAAPYTNSADATSGANSVGNDILFYGTQAYYMFSQYSVRAPGAPFGAGSVTSPAIRLYVNIDSPDAAAYGASCNGSDSCYNQQAFFGNGQTQFYPQVGYDVVGHELTHIYISRTSELVYNNQSGGMNEAFSDMTGVTLGAYIGRGLSWFPPISSTPPLNAPLGLSYWTQGALDSRTAPALRYLYNPLLNGSQINNAANYTNGMPVHNSSGVYDLAFFNFAYALGSNILINYDATLQAYRFFMAANDTNWTSNSTFSSGACGVIIAANNPAFGGNRNIAQLAVNAFASVGVRCTRDINKIKVT